MIIIKTALHNKPIKYFNKLFKVYHYLSKFFHKDNLIFIRRAYCVVVLCLWMYANSIKFNNMLIILHLIKILWTFFHLSTLIPKSILFIYNHSNYYLFQIPKPKIYNYCIYFNITAFLILILQEIIYLLIMIS